MRIENGAVPQIPGGVKSSSPRSAQAAATAATSDIIALSHNLEFVGTALARVESEREWVVNALHTAYTEGAIRPDPQRLASLLLRNERGE
jgi:hypothetical protein